MKENDPQNTGRAKEAQYGLLVQSQLLEYVSELYLHRLSKLLKEPEPQLSEQCRQEP